ncbi:hypothetical protein T492DRAFT_1038569 [Pavlovales sp. CCMP2436]|nr:hypothetical protein T492DRAFT_1038569 [Pavlovales sp. CCMP2436]
MLGCLLGMLLLRHSYGRYMLICSVYAGMLLDLPAIVTDKLALLARVREPPAASSASGARQVRLTSYSLAMSEAERRAPSGGEEEEEGDDLPRSEEDAWEAASTRGKPFLLRERAPRATQEGMAPVPTRTGGSVHPLYLSTANGGKVLERLHRRALHEVYRASLYDTAIKLSFAKLNRPSASESSESQDGSADDAEAGRSTPSERQVSLALVRELDALYLHMRERDADVLVRIAVERLCTCLFRLSSDGMGAREAVAEAEAEAEAEWMARTPPSQPSRRPTIPIERPEPGAVEEEGRLCAPNEGATAEGGGEAAAEMIC